MFVTSTILLDRTNDKKKKSMIRIFLLSIVSSIREIVNCILLFQNQYSKLKKKKFKLIRTAF